MIGIFDLTNATSWFNLIQDSLKLSPSSPLLILVLIGVFLIIALIIILKEALKKIGGKLGDSILNVGHDYSLRFFLLIKKILKIIPNAINRRIIERRIEESLKGQVELLSSPSKKIRRNADQKIVNILLSPLGAKTAVKFRIHERLIEYLSSDIEDVRYYAIQNLTRIVERTDKKTSVSSKLIKELIKNLPSENSKIRDDSLTLLRLIINNNCGVLFINSIESIDDPSTISYLIELLQNTLEIEEKNFQIQFKIFTLLNAYLQSDNVEIKRKTIAVLDKKIDERVSEIILESGIISSLLKLLLDENSFVYLDAQRLLKKLGKLSLLPEIMQNMRIYEETLPKLELSCLINDTISSNHLTKLIDTDILDQIFKYLSEREFQTLWCASQSIVQLVYMSEKSKKKESLIQKLIALDINNSLIALLSDKDSNVNLCGIQIILALIRVNGQKEVINEKIIDSLIHCLFAKSENVRRQSFDTLDHLINFKSIIFRLCRLGCEESWRDPVAERLATSVFHNKKDPIIELMDNFESNLAPEGKASFQLLRDKINEEMKKLESTEN